MTTAIEPSATLPSTMLAVRVHGAGDLRVDRIPIPTLQTGDALLRIVAAGICATDRKLAARGAPGGEPRVLGHEIVGEIAMAAAGTPPVGRRVAVAPNVGCGRCRACASGATNLCPDYRAFGIHLDGGMAEYLRIPRQAVERGHLLEVPESLPTLEAVALEPLACCLESLDACALRPGERVLVVGAGVMGRLHVAAARALGAGTIVVSDSSAERLDHALRLGADVALDPQQVLAGAVRDATGGVGVDVACVTVGIASAAEAAIADLARGGRLNLFAGFAADAARLALDANAVHYRRLQIVGTSGATATTLLRTLDLLAARRVALAGVVSSVRPFAEALVGFAEAGDPTHARVVLTPAAGPEGEATP